MAAKAMISSTYRWRLLLIALMGIGWGGWSIYDGFWNYPAQDVVANAFQEVKAKNPDTWRDVWTKTATANGWSTEDPGAPHSAFDRRAQYVMAAITLPFGLFFGWAYLTSFNRWVATDEQGVSTSTGQQAPFSSITKLNKDRWKTKGIARVYYTDSQGGERRIVLDDWKYEARPTQQMLEEIEAQLKPEQIVGGAAEVKGSEGDI